MSEAPERIWAKERYDSWGQYGHWYTQVKGGGTEYVRADLIKELEGMLPKDNRPCSTDRFLVAVVDEIDDHYDRLDAIKCWIEGAWDEAVEGTTLAELKGQDDE
jgi:hypothetical protein